MKIRGVIGDSQVTLDSQGLDYERLVAAIELLEYQIAVVENRDTPAPSPGLERGISISKLKEVLVVAGKKQKEIEVI